MLILKTKAYLGFPWFTIVSCYKQWLDFHMRVVYSGQKLEEVSPSARLQHCHNPTAGGSSSWEGQRLQHALASLMWKANRKMGEDKEQQKRRAIENWGAGDAFHQISTKLCSDKDESSVVRVKGWINQWDKWEQHKRNVNCVTLQRRTVQVSAGKDRHLIMELDELCTHLGKNCIPLLM